MTTLEDKFTALELQMTTQQTAVINALDSILTALGAPPPGPTITLADIAEQLTSMNDVLAAIQSDNSAFYAALLGTAGIISTNVETILTNNSLNAQRTIAAIYATFCACTTDAPTLSPPLDVTPTTAAEDEKCRRIQFYLSVFANWLDKIANYGNSASFVTGDVIGSLLSIAASEAGIVATGAEVGSAAGPPGIVIGAIVGLIAGAIFTFGGSVLIDYATQFKATVLQVALRQALYAEDNGAAGQTAFETTLNANMSTVPAAIISALWWSAWSNDMYSTSPTVDDSAFDGSICAPASGCITINSTVVGFASDGNGSAIVWPSPLSALNHTPAGYTATYAVWLSDDLIGYTITPSVAINWFPNWNFGSTTLPAGVTYTVPGHTVWASIHTYPSTTPFSIELCRPA